MKTATSPEKYFAPAKSFHFPLLFGVLNIGAVLILYFGLRNGPLDFLDLLFIKVWLLSIGYQIWKWSNTGYELKNGHLFYRSGFTKGSIPVSQIRKIETHTRGWGNILAALTPKGFMVTYNKWDEIFIAPKDEEEFLNEICKLNPDIEVKDHQNA